MDEQEKQEFAFIKEKIKQKPINKKRLMKQTVSAIAFGVLFGFAACLVFTYLQPKMENWLYPKENPKISFPGDEWSTELATEDSETEMGAGSSAEIPTVIETEASAEEMPAADQPISETGIEKELELADYQMLQRKIYAIGTEANRSVVTVTGVVSDTDWYNNVFESKGQASGIIIGDNGSELLILTEHKVVKEAEEISVTFIDDVTLGAALKKYDGNTGIAILSVDLQKLKDTTRQEISCAVLGNSLTVAQGNIAIAIGSPLGTNYSVGTGNITSVGNEVQTADSTYSLFTTDIVGSSNGSGVLLNLDGEVIGLVMQEYRVNPEDNTLTAISISELKKVIEMLSNGQDIPYLGLKAVTVTDKIASEYDTPKGVYIKEVLLDSPALEAGLQSGDVIVEMDGNAIATMEEYQEKVLALEPGEMIEIAVNRQGTDEYVRIEYSVTAGRLW